MPKTQLVAIGALALLECVALLTHTDGAFFMPIVACISALGGYTYGKYRKCDGED
jgi:quinol-cytochrome oxidoreductase complex cytochrome b subunit